MFHTSVQNKAGLTKDIIYIGACIFFFWKGITLAERLDPHQCLKGDRKGRWHFVHLFLQLRSCQSAQLQRNTWGCEDFQRPETWLCIPVISVAGQGGNGDMPNTDMVSTDDEPLLDLCCSYSRRLSKCVKQHVFMYRKKIFHLSH